MKKQSVPQTLLSNVTINFLVELPVIEMEMGKKKCCKKYKKKGKHCKKCPKVN